MMYYRVELVNPGNNKVVKAYEELTDMMTRRTYTRWLYIDVLKMLGPQRGELLRVYCNGVELVPSTGEPIS